MRFFICDTETTGLTKPIKVCEVGWIEVDKDLNVISEFDSLINPEQPIEPGASGVHNIREEQILNEPVIEDIEFPDGEICIIAHNSGFDRPLLAPYMNIVAQCDTLVLANRLLPESPDHKLGTLSAYCELPETLAHRALGDCRTVLNLIDYLMEGTGWNLIKLINWSNVPQLLTKVPFGKHKGIEFSELPSGYLHWMNNQSDWNIDIAHTLRNL